MVDDLKIIRKKYGEKMYHFCREAFPILLEEPGKLSKLSLCFTFWGLCDIIYMSRMNLERNIFDWLVNLNSFSTNEIVASQSKIFFLGFK